MIRRSVQVLVLFLLVFVRGQVTHACGVERWSVKTGTDADAGRVTFNPTALTIATARSWPAPNPIPPNNRVSPYETTEWVINATLTQYKLETDEDYHLVLQEASGLTMIAEIPAPGCVGAGSPFAAGIQNARSEFDAHYSATSSFQTANVPVQIKGIGMFDFLHGQTGVAPNGIEIHPVLDIVFNPSSTTYSISGNAGTSGALLSVGSASATSNSSSNYTISGLSAGSYTVTPSKSGCTFTPASSAVSITSANKTGVNFTASCGSTGGGALTNGNFETGSLSPWTATGVSSVIASGAHGGTYAAQLGSTAASTDSTLAQTFTLPSGANQVSLWVKITCPDTVTYDWVTASLKDNVSGTTTTLLPNTCSNTGAWQNVTGSVTANAGHSVTLTLANHDDNYAGDATYSQWDDVTVTTSAATYSISGNAGTTGATVTAGSASATSDSSSNYTLSGLAAGPYTVSSAKSGCTFTPASASVTVGPNATGVNFTASCSTGSTQLLANPGFESGAVSWTQSSGVIDNTTTEPAHSGSWKAWLDGYGSVHTDTIYQQVTIPSTASAATLTFWLHIDTAETTTTTAYDTLAAQVRNSSGTVLSTLATFSNLNAAAGYAQKSFNVIAYKGQTIQVYLVGTEDASSQTSFVVDDFALNVQ